jgi:hypothetical protein
MKTQESRPFNLEHARAGAPFCCASGEKVEVLKWDHRDRSCCNILGLIQTQEEDVLMKWDVNGAMPAYYSRAEERTLVMTPLGHIDGKPVFVGDELVDKKDGSRVTARPTWGEMNPELWAWPAPAKQYPVTGMKDGEMLRAWREVDQGDVRMSSLQHFANAALRHAVDNGQLVLPTIVSGKNAYVAAEMHERALSDFEKVQADLDRATRTLYRYGYTDRGGEMWIPPVGRRSEDNRGGRDMAIAEAVRDACYVAVMKCDNGLEGTVVRQIKLSDIIAKVQP